MEVDTSVIKDDHQARAASGRGQRGLAGAAGQHSRRSSHLHHKSHIHTAAAVATAAAAIPAPISSSNSSVAAAAAAAQIAANSSSSTTVTVKVGLNMNMCRLCLAEGTASARLQPVYYSKDVPDEALLQRILDLTTIQVTYATDFPSSICIGCKAKLEEYYHFRRQCIENDEILKVKYYEIKAAENYHRVHQQQQQQQVEEVKGEEYIDDGDDITLAIDESAEVEEYQEDQEIEEAPQPHQQQQQVVQQDQQVVEQQTIQYVAADGTMTEYVESGDVRTVSNSSQQQQIHISGYSEAEGIQAAAEGHEIYYTDGTDTYAIHTTAEGYVNAANYVPQGYDNQTEIECTTIEHLPEEEVYMDEGGSVGSIITPRGVHDRPFVCKHCKTSFKYEYNYERHMKNHAKVLYRCGKCSKTFTKQRKCQQHFLKAHSSQRYECDICFRTYSLPTRLENHVIEMHSENGVYKCDRCPETFTSYLDFKSHRNSHHNINGSSNNSPTVIAQAQVEHRTVQAAQPQQMQHSQQHPEQVQSPQPAPVPAPVPATRAATSISTRSSVSDSCDFEVMIDETKIQKPALVPLEVGEKREPPTEDMILATNEEAPPAVAAPSVVSRGVSKQVVGVPVVVTTAPTMTTAAVIPSALQPTTIVKSAPLSSVVTPTATVITNGVDKNSLHRQLLQQIEESEANSTGPKIYKCDNCVKTFVHLNNLKAHVYAEHDNDKPFKCKLCPISFKTKEILVMHMVLHSQHNTAT